MASDIKRNYISGIKKKIELSDLRGRIESKLLSKGIVSTDKAGAEYLYEATVLVMKDLMLEYRNDFKKRIKAQNGKRVCYICMEFLVGRSLRNYSHNLGIYELLCNIYKDYGITFEDVFSCEVDPGLGNGGLGRLAACFMESLTSMDYAANGYSLLYENGLFKQRIVDGEQVELPDEWLSADGLWLVAHPERSFEIKFGGKVEEKFHDGQFKVNHYNYESVKAVPYDLLLPGVNTNAVNTIRLWRARPFARLNEGFSSQSDYIKNLSDILGAESLTKQLYPPDNYDEGKLLRLSQQYFLVSATLQSIIADYLAQNGSLKGFSENIAIHINDTHPALCIPELMRILLDVYSYSWEDAWETVIKTVSYTNHTVLPEALECWRTDLFRFRLPRIYAIVKEINRRFTADLWNMYPGDWDRISRMSLIAYNQVRMANLSIVGSHCVNGVSRLHSEILKKSVFHDFYKLTPWKFTSVTNGVFHRRWLCYSNPDLYNYVNELTGKDISTDFTSLESLLGYSSDENILSEIGKIKKKNKERFCDYIYRRNNIKVNPDSIFDVQIKRMHEYKRQLLNILKIISIYNDLMNNQNLNIEPQTFIFGCKAAPGYGMAKRLIKLICLLSKELESTPRIKDYIKILFVEDYNVSVAENLIPAADISEQISLAGKEASGTGCMKLMMNGALTLGTLDGANVEIVEACGEDNAYIFGLNSNEVEQIWKSGYNSRRYYQHSEKLKGAIDRFYKPIAGFDFSGIADYLLASEHGIADPFMCLADFDSYTNMYAKMIDDYKNQSLWNKKCLINIATSHVFSADVSIKKYAENIWNISPINKIK